MSQKSLPSKLKQDLRYDCPQVQTARLNMSTDQVFKYLGRERRPEIIIKADICRRTVEPADSIMTDVLTEYRTAEYRWSDFKNLPGVKDLLEGEWDMIEQQNRSLYQVKTTFSWNAIWHWLFPCFSA